MTRSKKLRVLRELYARIPEAHCKGLCIDACGTIQMGAFEKDQIEAAPDPPALISQLAAEGKAAICDQTMTIFVSIYGAETGNIALTFLSTGGIFIGGSVAAKNLSRMKDPIFMQSFLDKGRMAPLLKEMPVTIVLNDDSGLIGAARYTLIEKAFRSQKRA